jgi:hypothetical protein
MIQTLYSLIAIMMLAVLTLTFNKALHSNDTRMILTEVSSQVTPVAMDILDYIGTLRYDASVEDIGLVQPSNLQDPIQGSTLCDPNNGYQGCADVMNELHGKTITRTVHGLTYNILVEFEYLDPINPDQVSPDPSFHKRATLTITSPELMQANTNTPLEIKIKRRFSYPRVTG